eukprot:gene16747-18441_t
MDYFEYGQDELKVLLKQKATELFKVCDKENKSFLTENDLLELTKELALTNDQVESAFAKLDKDGNKFLTLDEFIDGFGLFLGVEDETVSDPEMIKRQEKSRELFDLCDKGSKGYVTKSDLIRLTTDLRLSIDQVNLIFDKLDEDNNGFLTVYEFSQGFSEFLNDLDTMQDTTGAKLLGPQFINSDDYDETDLPFNRRNNNSDQKLKREASIEFLDSSAQQVIGNIDEYLTDTLTKEQLTELWKALRKNDSVTLTKFEKFLINISNEMKKARQETLHLENTLKRKSLSHDLEIQKLYEEMEQQIKSEKSRITELERKHEKIIKNELELQLEDKEYQINRILSRQNQLEDKIIEYQLQEQSLRTENLTLSKQNLDLEEQLNLSISSLEDTKNYVNSLQESTNRESQERIRAAMQKTQGIEKEHESLMRQLDMLREMNQKLRDDKDVIEASIKMRADRTASLDDELKFAEGKRPLQKTGSLLSSYFGTSKRGRLNSASSFRNKHCLEKQGSVMSNYFEPNWGSEESLSYAEGTFRERRLDSVDEEDQHDKGKKLIKAVNEHGESMWVDNDGRRRLRSDGDEYERSSMLCGEDDSSMASMKSKTWPEKTRLRRALPARPEEIKETREAELTTEYKISEREDTDAKPLNDEEVEVQDGTEIVVVSEDQLSATESEADRHVSSNINEEGKDLEQSKQELKAMLDDLAKPYTNKVEDYFDEVDKASPRSFQKQTEPETVLSPVQEEEPPQNPNRLYKIVFVGDSGVGKSSLIHRFCFDQFKPNFSATIGVDFQVKVMKVFTEWVALQLWDTAGQERFRSITKQYFRKADGVIVMFDLCSESSFKNVRSWMNSIEDSAEPECTVMVLGNKLDLADDGFRKINFELAARMAKEYNSCYCEVSAKSGEHVHQAMVKLAKKLEEKEDSLMKRSVLNLEVLSEQKKKKCCNR